MYKYVVLRVAAALASIAALQAQDHAPTSTDFPVPFIGLVFDDSAGQIRRIVGTPGAARVIPGTTFSTPFIKAVVAPGKTYGIAKRVGSGEGLDLVADLDRSASAASIQDAGSALDLAAFSPTGVRAGLYSRDCNCVRVLQGFPGSVSVERIVTVPAEGGPVTTIAVSDDGSALVVGTSRKVAIYSNQGGDSPSRLLDFGATALAISMDGSNLAAADADAKSIWMVRNLTGSAETERIAAEFDRIGKPVGVAFVSSTMLLVSDGDRRIHLFDLGAGTASSLDTTCVPTVAERTNVDNVFRLTGLETGSVWIAELAESGIRVLFVPVDRGEE